MCFCLVDDDNGDIVVGVCLILNHTSSFLFSCWSFFVPHRTQQQVAVLILRDMRTQSKKQDE